MIVTPCGAVARPVSSGESGAVGGLTATELARTPGSGARSQPALGAMAQLVARLVRNEKVRGSNPLSSTVFAQAAIEDESP